jgi:hypothetical protein
LQHMGICYDTGIWRWLIDAVAWWTPNRWEFHRFPNLISEFNFANSSSHRLPPSSTHVHITNRHIRASVALKLNAVALAGRYRYVWYFQWCSPSGNWNKLLWILFLKNEFYWKVFC